MQEITDSGQRDINRFSPEFVGKFEGVNYYRHPVTGAHTPLICKVKGFWNVSEIWWVPKNKT